MRTLDAEEIVGELRRACEEAGGQKSFAKQHGISPAYVWGVLSRQQLAGNGIAHALGYRRTWVYQKIEKKGSK